MKYSTHGGKNMKKNFKKILVTILAMVMMASTALIAHASSVNVGVFQEWDFYWRSSARPFALQLDADTVSFSATCAAPDETDELTCVIIDVTHNGAYSSTFDFTADGSVTTYDSGFPAGRYKIYFIGDSTILKDEATVVFSAFQ